MINYNTVEGRIKSVELAKTKKYYANLVQYVKSRKITMNELVEILDGGRSPPSFSCF